MGKKEVDWKEEDGTEGEGEMDRGEGRADRIVKRIEKLVEAHTLLLGGHLYPLRLASPPHFSGNGQPTPLGIVSASLITGEE